MIDRRKYFDAEDDEILTGEVLEFAREYRENDFPDPERENCPANSELLKLARSSELPSDDFRAHILSCSPCFLEFRAARRSTIVAPDLTKGGKNSFWFSFSLKHVYAALLVFIAAVAIIYIAFFQPGSEVVRQKDEIAVNNTEEKIIDKNISSNVVNSPTDMTVNKQNSAKPPVQQNAANSDATSEEPRLLARNTLNLDLSKAVVSRNGSSGKEEIFSLPSKPVTLKIKLRENSPAGDYRILLFDEFSQPIIAGETKPSNGRTITVKLNLRGVSKRARLCVTPIDEKIPDCFAVRIGNAP